jgi:adenine-specific DNA-methyltransferase
LGTSHYFWKELCPGLIYIDPPYNTGARDWTYNNNYVDAKDPYKHTKWLSFMNHRLRIAKNLLKSDGIICVTIDDHEMPRLWCLLEEIFGEKNHLGTVVIRNNPKGRKTNRKVSLIHEYAIFFGRTAASKIHKISVEVESKTHTYKKDKDGTWYLPVNLRKQGVDSLAKTRSGKISDRYYPIYYDPKTGRITTKTKLKMKILPIDVDGEKRIWRRGKEDIDDMFDKGDLWYQKTKYGDQIYFKFRGGLDGEPPQSIWLDSTFSASEYGTQILDKILGVREAFPFPKSPHAVAECIRVASNKKDAIVLDFFAGSGTTGQAVLELNKQDGGNRRFILCTNNENRICDEITYPRISNVIKGYKFKGKQTEQLFEEKITYSNLKDPDDLIETIERTKLERQNEFDDFDVKVEDGFLRLYGTRNVSDVRKGLGGNLKFYRTDFVDADPSDKNKRKMVAKSTEMLCLKEECFDEVKEGHKFKIFTNGQGKLLGIIYDDDGIEPFKKEAKKMKKHFVVYVFSLDESAREDEFEDVEDLVELKPIPAVILNVYRRIFK